MRAAKTEGMLSLVTCVKFLKFWFENCYQNHSEISEEHRGPGLLKLGRALGLCIFIVFPSSPGNSNPHQSLSPTAVEGRLLQG